MGLTLHSLSLSAPLFLLPHLYFFPSWAGRETPPPPQVTLKRSGVNGPAFCVLLLNQNDPVWSHICRHSIIIMAAVTPLFPSSLWPFLLRPWALTWVNTRVHNPVGLIKLLSLLTHERWDAHVHKAHTDTHTHRYTHTCPLFSLT